MIHWLTLKASSCDPVMVMDCIDVVLGQGGGWKKRSEQLWQHITGLTWGYKNGSLTLTIPGAACDALSRPDVGGVLEFVWLVREEVRAQLGLVPMPEQFDWRASRVDWAIDNVGFSPSDLRRMFISGNKRKDKLKADGIRDGFPVISGLHADSWSWHERPTGTTCYLGSRESSRLLRCYDRRGPTRLELELHRERAESVFDFMLQSAKDGAKVVAYMCGVLRGMVDFPKWGAWQRMLKGAESVKLCVHRAGVDLARTLSWLKRQAGAVLAALDYVPGEFVQSIIEEKRLEKPVIARAVHYMTEIERGSALSDGFGPRGSEPRKYAYRPAGWLSPDYIASQGAQV
jgi:hypothetical protein